LICIWRGKFPSALWAPPPREGHTIIAKQQIHPLELMVVETIKHNCEKSKNLAFLHFAALAKKWGRSPEDCSQENDEEMKILLFLIFVA